ncbi:FtsX-like permease family protein [Phytohabitans kaempferiae]|uniref:FtsX-like permease family protein n=1 Tax=Phytohabitans kaempferiae TaxID=1620943 RepID=A0ABV6LUS5_9ACTN
MIATVLLTGLADYSREVVDAGARSAVASAAPEERSVLIQGPAGGTAFAERDAAVHDRYANGFAGLDARVSTAGYAVGRQLTGEVGDANPDKDGVVFASVTFLDGLAEHADLVGGAWPEPGATPRRTALAEAAARTLHLEVGDRITVHDRLSRTSSEIEVSGIWRPRDPNAPYWRLAPGVGDGAAPQSSTYGPFVVDRADFLSGFSASASAAWLVEPDLAGASLAQLDGVARAATEAVDTLAEDIGLGSSGLVTSRLDQLTERLERADMVGRSALITPMLLMVVLGGYALVLVAVLMNEQRRGETALLRARGAARLQLAGLAAREAALVVLPAAVLAPLLASQILEYVDRVPMLAAGALRLAPRFDTLTWAVAALAAAGCAVAMLGPALRRGDTYVAEMASRSRPTRRAAAQRASLDIALVGLAVLGWFQLRQYSSPLAGGNLGIDPLLAASPTLGVLAGAAIALRALPPLTRLAERAVDRKPWTATIFGMWQAGRRPQAGPVLLLALAVAVSTLAWCLAGTSERSLVDQADHSVGADLRLVEATRYAPEGRAAEITALPGAETALPAWRDSLRLGTESTSASVISLDAAAAAGVVRIRDDVAGGSPQALFAKLSEGRAEAPVVELPAETRRISGEVVTQVANWTSDFYQPPEPEVRTDAVFAVPGGYQRVPLGVSTNAQPLRFAVDLPEHLLPARLAGFTVGSSGPAGFQVSWRVRSLVAGDSPVDLAATGQWQARTRAGTEATGGEGPTAQHTQENAGLWGYEQPLNLVVTRVRQAKPVPVVATPAALTALRLGNGDETRMSLGQDEVGVRIAGTVAAVPGTEDAAALLADLPSLAAEAFYGYGEVRQPQEWWLATGDDPQATATAAAALSGIQVLDRRAAAEEAGRDPYGVGARAALFAAALGAVVIAAMGIGVDIRATARRRIGELAVLHTLGASPRLLGRSLVAEQTFLAGVGVLVGLVVGIGVAATMAPLVILTPAAGRPVPEPLLTVVWSPVGATAAGLLLLTLALSASVALAARQRLIAAQLRIGADA